MLCRRRAALTAGTRLIASDVVSTAGMLITVVTFVRSAT